MPAALSWRKTQAGPDAMKAFSDMAERVIKPAAPIIFWALALLWVVPALMAYFQK